MPDRVSLSLKLYLSLAIVFSLFCVSSAWSAGNDIPVLKLEQLITMALETNAELKAAGQDVASSRADLAKAKAGSKPQLDATAVVGPIPNADEPTVIVNPNTWIGKIKSNESGVGIFTRLDVNIVQPLYTFGKISHRKDAATFGVEVQKAAREKKRGDIVLNIQELYYGLTVANQGRAAAEDADVFLQDAHQRIKRLLGSGSTTVDESDLYRLEAFEAEIKQFQIKAETGAQMAYIALKTAVGYPAGADFRLDIKELPRKFDGLGQLEDYTSRAMELRPELEQVRKGVEAQEAMVEAAIADRYPSFFAAVIGSVAAAPARERVAGFYIQDQFNRTDIGFVLGTQWHFDFGIGRGSIEKARAEHLKLLYTKEYAEQNIPLEVTKYYTDAVEARGSAEAFDKAVIAARKWIVAAFTNFDMGTGRARDLFDAIERYGKNQAEYLLALYNYHMSVARLNHSVASYRTEHHQNETLPAGADRGTLPGTTHLNNG